jgi:type IV secretion system protein VirD4
VLAAERSQSVAVVGPTQSGKTSALAVPAILAWDGPVVAASVKTDLVRDTLACRRRCGNVWCFDPAGTTGLPAAQWSPLTAATTWAGARRVAGDLTEVSRADGTTADGEFWYATAAKLLAPLLFAAASGHRTMRDVVRWVDIQETEEVADILHAAGVPEALQAARATWLRDDRQRSAVYTTAETVLEPFAEPPSGPAGTSPHLLPSTPPYGVPAVLPRAEGDRPAAGGAGCGSDPEGEGRVIDPEALLLGHHTLYLCAPVHDQRRFRALFVAVVQQVLQAAFARSARLGRPLDPPLLVVLDEAANIAPLRDLDVLAATCAGHGVQLVTIWQDLAQVRARYGERAPTVVNNHRAKLFLPGIADPGTLDFASHLAGETDAVMPSLSFGPGGERTVTHAPVVRRVLAPDALRRLPAGTGVLLYGGLPPARVRLRPWFTDRSLVERGTGHRAPGRAP